jgi:hypothetical protein
MLRPLSVFLLATVIFFTFSGAAQTQRTDPHVVTTEAQAALGSQTFQDLVISANAQWIAGSTNESGRATLKAKGIEEARFDLSAGTSSRSENRNDLNGPSGEWVAADGTPHSMALHNCFMPAAWFAPSALVQTMMAPSAVLNYVGQENRDGVLVDHLQVHQANTGAEPHLARELVRLTTFDIFLNASSHLPMALLFKIHADNDPKPRYSRRNPLR